SRCSASTRSRRRASARARARRRSPRAIPPAAADRARLRGASERFAIAIARHPRSLVLDAVDTHCDDVSSSNDREVDAMGNQRLWAAAAACGWIALPAPSPAVPGPAGCGSGSWIAGTVELCAGELVYRDYVYDDYGAQGVTPGPSTGT